MSGPILTDTGAPIMHLAITGVIAILAGTGLLLGSVLARRRQAGREQPSAVPSDPPALAADNVPAGNESAEDSRRNG